MELTQFMYQIATDKSLTVEDAVKALKENADIRTIKEILSKAVGIPVEDTKSLQRMIVDHIMATSPEDTKRNSVTHNVHKWLIHDVQTISKENAVQIAFALQMDPETANHFLCKTCGESFHWRDPADIIFNYALRKQMTYADALALYAGIQKNTEAGNASEMVYTYVIRETAEQIDNDTDLKIYLEEAKGILGTFHNTAYEFFRKYMAILQLGDALDGMEMENKKTVSEVLEENLFIRLIPRIVRFTKTDNRKQKLILDAIRRDIQQNWPDKYSISKMLNRKIDVSRKALILLFLATNGEADFDFNSRPYLSADEDSEEEGFEARYMRINLMLIDCGFSPTDPRNPFDWMVLYILCIDEMFFADFRIKEFLEKVFDSEAAEIIPETVCGTSGKAE